MKARVTVQACPLVPPVQAPSMLHAGRWQDHSAILQSAPGKLLHSRPRALSTGVAHAARFTSPARPHMAGSSYTAAAVCVARPGSASRIPVRRSSSAATSTIPRTSGASPPRRIATSSASVRQSHSPMAVHPEPSRASKEPPQTKKTVHVTATLSGGPAQGLRILNSSQAHEFAQRLYGSIAAFFPSSSSGGPMLDDVQLEVKEGNESVLGEAGNVMMQGPFSQAVAAHRVRPPPSPWADELPLRIPVEAIHWEHELTGSGSLLGVNLNQPAPTQVPKAPLTESIDKELLVSVVAGQAKIEQVISHEEVVSSEKGTPKPEYQNEFVEDSKADEGPQCAAAEHDGPPGPDMSLQCAETDPCRTNVFQYLPAEITPRPVSSPDYCSTLDLSPTETTTTCPSTTATAFGPNAGDNTKPDTGTDHVVCGVYPRPIPAVDVGDGNSPSVSTELAGLSVRRRTRSSSPSPGHTRGPLSKGQGPNRVSDEFTEAAHRSVEVQTSCRQGPRGEAARKLQTDALVLSSQLTETLRELDEALLWEDNASSKATTLSPSADRLQNFSVQCPAMSIREDGPTDASDANLKDGDEIQPSQVAALAAEVKSDHAETRNDPDEVAVSMQQNLATALAVMVESDNAGTQDSQESDEVIHKAPQNLAATFHFTLESGNPEAEGAVNAARGPQQHSAENSNSAAEDSYEAATVPVTVGNGDAEAGDSDEAARWLQVATCAEQRLISEVSNSANLSSESTQTGIDCATGKAPLAFREEPSQCQAEPSGLLDSPPTMHDRAAINAQFNTPSRTTNKPNCGTSPWSVWSVDIDAERAVARRACEEAAELSRRLAKAMEEVDAARNIGTPLKETSRISGKGSPASMRRAPPPTPCRGRSRSRGQPASGVPPTPPPCATSSACAESAATETSTTNATSAGHSVSEPGNRNESGLHSKRSIEDSCHACQWYLLGTPQQLSREPTTQSHDVSPAAFAARAASAAALRALQSPKLHIDVPNPLVAQNSEKVVQSPDLQMYMDSPDVKKGLGLNGVLARLSDLESWLGDVKRVGSHAERKVIGIESPSKGQDVSPSSVFPCFSKVKKEPSTSDSMSPDSLEGSIRIQLGSLDERRKERALQRHLSGPQDLVGDPFHPRESGSSPLDEREPDEGSKALKGGNLKLKFAYHKGKSSTDPWISSCEGPGVASHNCNNSMTGRASLFGA
eukprot:gnl/MRDRNA2_/MRDRNA2_108394_c0_seq1.p1 gnl/MRDRNA2_/MRDRNA2_108394_c0~~gnl/MRDRNA2_/MRDRNA2_108394_c0_seq1.p1  ORF type:complete len:1198 (-),score=227.13 gnl/MRDRNA2_/MRDRNA2_108394_c0_seq1:24-3617(-)